MGGRDVGFQTTSVREFLNIGNRGQEGGGAKDIGGREEDVRGGGWNGQDTALMLLCLIVTGMGFAAIHVCP